VLTQTGACSQTQGGTVSLDPSRFRVCGDFDIQADFELTTFPVPASGSRYLAMRTLQPASSNGVTLERYDISATNGCVPAREDYKAWTTTSSDCSAHFVAGSDISGSFRLTRVGTTVTAYRLASADAGGSDAAPQDAGGGPGWVQVFTGTSTTVPFTLLLYTGYTGGSDPAHQSVRVSNLRITSASAP
jgi:hypothetical protein